MSDRSSLRFALNAPQTTRRRAPLRPELSDIERVRGFTLGGAKSDDRKGPNGVDKTTTPHVAQNNQHRKSAIDGRTTRHAGYAVSQQKRKRVEEIFGWMKTIGGMRKLRHRGLELVRWMFTFAAAAYNLVRIRNLTNAVAGVSV